MTSSDEDEFYSYEDLFRLTNRQQGDLNSKSQSLRSMIYCLVVLLGTFLKDASPVPSAMEAPQKFVG